MRNKLFLIAIALCIGLQPNISFASEKQSWVNWFRAKWTNLTKTPEPLRPYVKTAAGLTIARMVPMVITGSTTLADLVLASQLMMFILFIDVCDMAINSYQIGAISKRKAIENITDSLMITLNKDVLYPTRSSKIHALLKKDEFLQYITDEYGLVQEACNELIGKINAIPYSNEEKEIDRAIDTKMTEFKNTIIQYETLDDQIKALENQKQALDISGMQAYLSVYFRLKNKQAVEQKLSPEEKVSRQSWSRSAQKTREVSEPSID